jgi:hypothetical protein
MNHALFGPQNKTAQLQQLHDGQPLTLIDTTGEVARAFANRTQVNRTLYFNPSMTARPVGLNVLDSHLDHPQLAEQITDLLFHLFPSGSNTLTRENTQFLLDNSLRLLLIQDGPQTLLSVLKLLYDTDFRDECLLHKKLDTVVLDNWKAILDPDNKPKALFFSLRTKLGKVLGDPIIRNIVGQPYSTFPENITIIANLDRSKIGNARAKFLGGLLIARSTGHVVITDYGFFCLPIPLEQDRFTIGVNFLDELPLTLRQSVLNIPDKYVFNTNRKDAEALSFYVDAPNPSSLMGQSNSYRWTDGKNYEPDTLPSLNHLKPLKKRTRACHTADRLQVERDIKNYLEG